MRTYPVHWVNMLETGMKEAKAKLKWVEEWVRRQMKTGNQRMNIGASKPFHFVAHVENYVEMEHWTLEQGCFQPQV